MIKEREINELSVSLNGSRMAQLLACHQAELLIKGEATMHQTVDQTDLKETVIMTKREKVDVFVQSDTLLNENHASQKQHECNDSSSEKRCWTPTCLMAWACWTHMEVISGSKQVAVVVENLMAVPIIIAKGVKVAQIVAVNTVPLWNWHPEL